MKGSKRETELGSGIWRLRVYIGIDPLTGKKRVKEQRFHGSSRQADTELARMVADADGKHNHSGATTLDATICQWLDLIRADRSPTTVHSYEGILVQHIRPSLGRKRLDELDASDLDVFYRALRRTLSAARVQRVHAVIRAALGQAVKWGWVEANVALRATLPGGTRRVPVQLTADDVRRLLAAQFVVDPDLAVLMVCAAATGARRGELCGLQWRDVDLEQGEVTIRRAVVHVGRETTVKDTKTHAERVVAIDQATVAILVEFRRVCLERARLCAVRLGPTGFVWSRDPAGRTPLVPDVVSGSWRRLVSREGLPGRRFHDLRHFHASVLVDAGVPMAMVSERLGHSMLSTTQNIYTHAVHARDREAATAIGELLAGR